MGLLLAYFFSTVNYHLVLKCGAAFVMYKGYCKKSRLAGCVTVLLF